MRIVVLDGYTTNPGDLSWEPLARLGKLTVYEDTPPELVVARAKDADALLYNRVLMTAELLEKLPRLRYLGTFSTGVNTTDLAAAAQRGIPVCNIPSYCEDTVAQFTFSLLLALCNHVESHHRVLMQEGWHESVEAGIRQMPFIELAGKTLGLSATATLPAAWQKSARLLVWRFWPFAETVKRRAHGAYRGKNC